MPEFDIDGALDPEAAERREHEAYIEQRRQHDAAAAEQRRVAEEARAARQVRIDPALAYLTRRDSWDAWVWPTEVPEYLRKHILRRCLHQDLADILKLIERVYVLDSDHDSDVVEAVCDRRAFDMDDVERDFEDHNYEIVDDAEDYAREYAENMGEIPQWVKNYIDWETMGKDLLQDQETADLSDGRTLVFRD